MKIQHIIGLLCLLFFSISCGEGNQDLEPCMWTAPEPSTTSCAVISSSDIQVKMLAYINEIRAQGCTCGSTYFPPASPLTWNFSLQQAAERHASDMSTNQTTTHTGSDGSTAPDRITAAGYSYLTWAESLATGYASIEEVMQAWMDSPGHCANILDSRLTEVGVAQENCYWVQVFGEPR